MSASRFNTEARYTLASFGLTTRAWALSHGYTSASEWQGDACGCTDDRCIGHHHGEQDDCLCLPALIWEHQERESARRRARRWPVRS